MLKTKQFWSLFGALVLTTLAFQFFPDPYNRDLLLEEGFSNREIMKRFAIYFAIGVGILFITTILFHKVIQPSANGIG